MMLWNARYSLHRGRSDKRWTKGRGKRGEGKERLPQDPVLLKSAPHINGCTRQTTANQNLLEGKIFFPRIWSEGNSE